MKNQRTTFENKAHTRNGIKRLFFSALSILLEVIFIIVMVTRLSAYWELGVFVSRAFAAILVLFICGQHRAASIKIPWIILIMVLPITGTCLYLLIGLNVHTYQMKKRYKDIDEALYPLLPGNKEIQDELLGEYPAAASVAAYLQAKSKAPVWKNTDVEYYSSGAAGLEAQLEEMAKAQSFIFMEYHAIETEIAWKRIEKVLVDRVKAGVEVRVFYDDLGSISFITTDFVKKLEKLGIKCRVFNPFMPGLNVFLNNRDHRKITVIDGKTGFTGGYNIADEYFGITHPYGEWKDAGIKVTGDAVRSFTIMFLEMWNAVKSGDIDDLSYEQFLPKIDYKAKENCFVQPYADSPLDDEHVGEETYISMVNGASGYCYFCSPYLIPTDEMVHALSLAAKRGVDVRIVTPGIPDKNIVYSVTRSFYNSFTRNGVRIYEWTPGFAHSKLCLVDDRMVACGTINIDYRSFYHHFENGCFMVGCDAIKDIRQDFEDTFLQCREVTEYYNSGRGRTLRVWQLILRLFAEVL